MRFQRKKRILIVADQPKWAYHAIALNISRFWKNSADIYIDFTAFHLKPQNSQTPFHFLYHQLKRSIKKLRWQKIRKDQEYDVVIYLGFYMRNQYPLKGKEKSFLLGIYTSGFPPQGVCPEDINLSYKDFEEKYLTGASAILCGDLLTSTVYQEQIKIPVYYAPGGMDLGFFKRLKPKQKNKTEIFTVGWTGNPKRSFKGYYDFVIPAVEEATRIRPGIRLKSRFSGPMRTLPRFYDDVDVVLIASSADAGPYMFEEAARCDIPAISTKIARPAEVIKDGINGFFVNRDIHEMAEKIVQLYDDRELLFSMSTRIKKDFLELCGIEQQYNCWKTIWKKSIETDSNRSNI